MVFRSVAWTLVLLSRHARSELTVTSPSELWTVVAGSPYSVELDDAAVASERDSAAAVNIDLYYCGDYCQENECGQWLADLCSDGDGDDGGCSLVADAYDVVMPEPAFGTSWGYKVGVTMVEAGDEASTLSCSQEFRLMASDEYPGLGKTGAPFLDVMSPSEGNFAVAGEDYTVEFAYDGGVSSETDRFTVDLYMAGGGGGTCGLWVESLCDDPYMGYKDSGVGMYDVTIPSGAKPGFYSIRVGRAGEQSLFACSGEFEVVAPGNPMVN